MSVAIAVCVILHLLGAAAILVGWAMQRFGEATLTVARWGARAQLLTGILLVGLHQMAGDDVDNTKVAVKLVVAIAVAACIEIAAGRARRGDPQPVLADIGAGLALLNVLIAVLWTTST